MDQRVLYIWFLDLNQSGMVVLTKHKVSADILVTVIHSLRHTSFATTIHGVPYPEGEGGYSKTFWMGVYCWDSETLTCTLNEAKFSCILQS